MATDATGNKTELGCPYEATQSGTKDLVLPDGSHMKYLRDGDEIVLGGHGVGTWTVKVQDLASVSVEEFYSLQSSN